MTQDPMSTSGRQQVKVSIVGCGMVGSTLAYTLVMERAASELVLVDIDADRARGEARDINHAMPFAMPTRVREGDYEDCRGSNIVVITAGAAQKAGESRLTLADRNVEIFKDILPRLVRVAPEAVLLIVSNPVDILTYASIRISGLPWQRVIGSGTILDTARFRYEISATCGVDPRNVHAYIIGEHGDSEVPVWSLTNIAGMRLIDFCRCCPHEYSQEKMDAIFERVKNAAYDIIALKGATYFAIALGATRMVQAIVRDQKSIVTASGLLRGQYGIRDVCLSLPVMLGRNGIERVVEMPISTGEADALRQSAEKLKSVLGQVGFQP